MNGGATASSWPRPHPRTDCISNPTLTPSQQMVVLAIRRPSFGHSTSSTSQTTARPMMTGKEVKDICFCADLLALNILMMPASDKLPEAWIIGILNLRPKRRKTNKQTNKQTKNPTNQPTNQTNKPHTKTKTTTTTKNGVLVPNGVLHGKRYCGTFIGIFIMF